MSDRERWIVYPLLFLALGAALRDKLAKQTRAKQIVCEQLYVVDNEGRPLATLTGDQLRLDLAGRSYGYITAGVIDAETLAQRGKPVVTAGGPAARPRASGGGSVSLQDLLKMLPQLQLIPTPRPAPPAQPNAGPVKPNPREKPPAGGPRLGPAAPQATAEPNGPV